MIFLVCLKLRSWGGPKAHEPACHVSGGHVTNHAKGVSASVSPGLTRMPVRDLQGEVVKHNRW